VGLIMLLDLQADIVVRAGIAWFGMGPTPIAAAAAEQALTGRSIREIAYADFAQLALSETEPADDLHASARYRRTVGARILERNLRTLAKEIEA